MVTTTLLSTVLMGGLLLIIVAVVLRIRDWQQPHANAAGASEMIRAANGPVGWSVAFFIVAFGVMGLAMLYAAGAPVAGINQAAVGVALALVLVAVFSIAGVAALYAAAQSRGLNSAQAAGFSSVVLATLVLLAIVVQLFLSG